ncbi:MULTISPECIES: flagellar biosynthesis protein FliQ [Alicyclobacillus]|uniref:Flagellar biosynthetic protein FliQ n=3 Tax=Alicyclobacillus TaxID=29330 RepID=C8WWG3_ALIAD|nr:MULTISPECIES: flagellar biosynthesis protein FliQ [Alicyclobacillus]ACV58434.1 flagellar biosynthetic protein FliQ [Alicyclobacillus acidocaldarius subsp. acidocaldarius DSM 446]AEJ43281.1 flagellar biosynthetic protein FliQ [Alicyclobacillus acidocaldarius subsp. acidocaldarius Tc-4-1]MDI9259078.1 flagellar biosynthesis protein FliQ [Alicyclobacillus sendaiensis PA2]
MTDTYVIGLAAQVMWLVVKITAPVLLLGLAMGLVVSIFQATTQLQEQTLAFIPKIIAVVIALLAFGPWMLQNLIDFTNSILGNLMQYVM